MTKEKEVIRTFKKVGKRIGSTTQTTSQEIARHSSLEYETTRAVLEKLKHEGKVRQITKDGGFELL
jgi:ribosomal protein S25